MPYTFALSGHRKPSVGAVSSSASSGVMVRVDIGAPPSETTAEMSLPVKNYCFSARYTEFVDKLKGVRWF